VVDDKVAIGAARIRDCRLASKDGNTSDGLTESDEGRAEALLRGRFAELMKRRSSRAELVSDRCSRGNAGRK
jgi:hypothetical protein